MESEPLGEIFVSLERFAPRKQGTLEFNKDFLHVNTERNKKFIDRDSITSITIFHPNITLEIVFILLLFLGYATIYLIITLFPTLPFMSSTVFFMLVGIIPVIGVVSSIRQLYLKYRYSVRLVITTDNGNQLTLFTKTETVNAIKNNLQILKNG